MTCDEVFDVLTRGPFPSGAGGDEQVENHLDHCSECRRLATALQPAVELFNEAVGPEESRRLPGYRGRATLPDAYRIFEYNEEVSSDETIGADSVTDKRSAWSRPDAASRPRPTARSSLRVFGKVREKSPASSFKRVTKARTNLFRFAAAVLLGVAAAGGSRGLVALWATLVDFPEKPPGTVQAAASVEKSRSERDPRAWAGLALSPACTPRATKRAGDADVAAMSLSGIQLASVDATSRLDCCTDCHNSASAGLLPAEARSVVARACGACH